MRNSILAVAIGLATLCISGVHSQVTIVSSSKNMTVKLGHTVTLICQFNMEATCLWTRGVDNRPKEIIGRYRYVAGDASRKMDCSIEISNVDQSDIGQWGCATYDVSPAIVWLSEQKTPSLPKIYFMGKQLTELVFPLAADNLPPSNLSCISEKGNPLPKLSWVLNGQPVPGNTENITVTEDQLFSTRLTWSYGDWTMFNKNNGPLKCVLEHVAYDQPQVANVKFFEQYATKHVDWQVDGISGNSAELGANEQLVLTCAADGQPKPNIAWEFLADGEASWIVMQTGSAKLTVTGPKYGQFRCNARNKLNTLGPVNSSEFYVKAKLEVETSNFGVVIGIIIGCLVIIVLVGLLVIFLYRRKKWIFAPKTDSTPVNVDTEAVDHENEKPTEKTPLESVPDPQLYENLKQNGKEEEMNGKTDTSPIKNDQNDNKKSTEVVYAQLDLSKRGVAKVKPPPEYEKTEYAEIAFNNDKGNNV